METPTSTRRVTRSQSKASFSNISNLSSKKIEESEKSNTKKSKQRTCLIDITNDSPIVGLASGNISVTPISSLAKQKRSKICNKTPGSGEALLRGQVKNLLQKVEEEAEISKFLSFNTSGGGRHGLKAFLNSPAGLLAPTPANTPQVLNFNSALDGFGSLASVMESPIEDQLTISKVVNGMQQSESERDIISRTLFLDFSDKSDLSPDCLSDLTHQGTGESMDKETQLKSPSKDDDDDDASIWSIQANASTQDEENDDEVYQGDLEDELDELCEGLKSISVNEGKTFMGKHVRFVYNSEDELVEEEVEGDVLRLKGLPTPKGKHLRFQDAADE